jgi:hypothetical protein
VPTLRPEISKPSRRTLTFTVEKRKERWTFDREWRERKLRVYSTFLADIKRMRDLAQRIAAVVGLDEQAPPMSRDTGLEQLAEANMARSASFETVNLIAGRAVVEAGRELNRTVWRLEWFARGFLDDADREGWAAAFRAHHAAINDFHKYARLDVGVSDEFSPRSTEPSPKDPYDHDIAARKSPTNDPA